MISIAEAQQDMRKAYFGGATGALTSATVWLVAAIAVALIGPQNGVLTLILGGMLIFPVSVFLAKALGQSGKHNEINPLGPIGPRSALWMLLSIPIAYGLAQHRVEWGSSR